MRLLLCLLTVSALLAKDSTVQILDKDGQIKEVNTALKAIKVEVGGQTRSIPLLQILSVHSAEPASANEKARIEKDIPIVAAADQKTSDRAQRDAAVADLVSIGLPVMTPLLLTYKDTDQHEPRPLYRLFERIIPSRADGLDRTLSLIRLTNGEALRGKVEPFVEAGLNWATIRRLAVKQKSITRNVEVHSLMHCTKIEWFDTGIGLVEGARIDSKATGFTRLSWETDGWATDPDGLQKPGPNYKTNLVDGHPFGALVARVGTGENILLGTRALKQGFTTGRLLMGINDNGHWQNNLGRYTVRLTATDAYDLGDPQ